MNLYTNLQTMRVLISTGYHVSPDMSKSTIALDLHRLASFVWGFCLTFDFVYRALCFSSDEVNTLECSIRDDVQNYNICVVLMGILHISHIAICYCIGMAG